MTARRHLPSELIIGVVGPYDLVERIMLSGAAARDEAFGMVPAAPGQAAAGGTRAPGPAAAIAVPGGGTGPARGDRRCPSPARARR